MIAGVLRRLSLRAALQILALIGAWCAAGGFGESFAAPCTAGPGLRQIAPAPQSLHSWCDPECRLVDSDGNRLQAAGTVAAGTHSEGLTIVTVGRLRGYVDDGGRWAVPARFEDANAFCDGIAPVLDPATKAWGFIGHDGQFVIPPGFQAAGPMMEGLAPVRRNDRWGFVDRSDALVIEPIFDEADVFSEGLAAVRKGEKWGYVDKTGAFVIATHYDAAASFRDGIALITLRGATAPKTFGGLNLAEYRGVIDHRGKIVVPPAYESIRRLSTDIIAASSLIHFDPETQDEAMRINLFKHDGSLLVDQTFEEVDSMAEGLIPACRRGRCGYLDTAGHLAVDMHFDQVRSFSEGRGGVVSGDRGQFIDRTGRVVIPSSRSGPRLDTGGAWRFADGLAPAACEGRWGYLDREGRWAVSPVFTSASEIDDGIGQVRQGARTGHVIAKTRRVTDLLDVDVRSASIPRCGASMAPGD